MLDWLDAQIGEGDAVLFKGSNSMKLGETAARFISVEKTPTSFKWRVISRMFDLKLQ